MLALIAALAAQASLTCESVRAVAPDARCTAAAGGLVLTQEADAAQAPRLVEAAVAATERYRRYFGVEPAGFVIPLGADPARTAALRALGPVVFPMMTAEQMSTAREASVRRGALLRAAERGLTGAALEAFVDQQLAQYRTVMANTPADSDLSVVAHELGHMWFTRQYWPANQGAGQHYGGPAPDWLDELAAILMEDATMTMGRKRALARSYASPEEKAGLENLTHFLTRDHPMKAATQRIARSGGGGGPIVLMGEEARRASADGALFYLQARAFADFMLERTGDDRVFANIAQAIASGGTFEAWLAANGAAKRLPTTVPALQSAFVAWLPGYIGRNGV